MSNGSRSDDGQCFAITHSWHGQPNESGRLCWWSSEQQLPESKNYQVDGLMCVCVEKGAHNRNKLLTYTKPLDWTAGSWLSDVLKPNRLLLLLLLSHLGGFVGTHALPKRIVRIAEAWSDNLRAPQYESSLILGLLKTTKINFCIPLVGLYGKLVSSSSFWPMVLLFGSLAIWLVGQLTNNQSRAVWVSRCLFVCLLVLLLLLQSSVLSPFIISYCQWIFFLCQLLVQMNVCPLCPMVNTHTLTQHVWSHPRDDCCLWIPGPLTTGHW